MTDEEWRHKKRIKPEDKPLTLEHVEAMAKDLQLTNGLLGAWLRMQFIEGESQGDMMAQGVSQTMIYSLERMGCIRVVKRRRWNKQKRWVWAYLNITTLRERDKETKLWIVEYGDDEAVILDGMDEGVARSKFKHNWHLRKLKKITRVDTKSTKVYLEFLSNFFSKGKHSGQRKNRTNNRTNNSMGSGGNGE